MIPSVQSLIDYYVNLLIIQYHNQPKAQATIALFIQELLVNNLAFAVQNGYQLVPSSDNPGAVGKQLDVLGKYEGIDRFYRQLDLEDYFSLIAYNEYINLLAHGLTLEFYSTNTNVVFTRNSVVSPDGATDAASFVPDTGTVDHWLGQSGGDTPITIVAGQAFDMRIYVKRIGTGLNRYFWRAWRSPSAANYCGVSVDLQAGTVHVVTQGTGTVGSVSIVPLANGWYEIQALDCVLDGATTTPVGDGGYAGDMGGAGFLPTTSVAGDGINGFGLWNDQFIQNTAFADRYGFTDYAGYGSTPPNGCLIYDEIIAGNHSLVDDAFRTLIELKIVQNYSDHSCASIDAGLYKFFGDTIRMEDMYYMRMAYFISGDITPLINAILFKKVLPRPMAVLGLIVSGITGDMFAMTDYSGYESPFGFGFTDYADYGTTPGQVLTYDMIAVA